MRNVGHSSLFIEFAVLAVTIKAEKLLRKKLNIGI